MKAINKILFVSSLTICLFFIEAILNWLSAVIKYRFASPLYHTSEFPNFWGVGIGFFFISRAAFYFIPTFLAYWLLTNISAPGGKSMNSEIMKFIFLNISIYCLWTGILLLFFGPGVAGLLEINKPLSIYTNLFHFMAATILSPIVLSYSSFFKLWKESYAFSNKEGMKTQDILDMDL
jgi:hypothetical protein